MPRYQARGLRRSPASYRRGACLLIPRTLVFRDGYPSTFRRCESRRNSLPRTDKGAFVSSNPPVRIRACYPLPTSCIATRGSGMPLTRGCPAFPWSERSRRFRRGRDPLERSVSESGRGRGGGDALDEIRSDMLFLGRGLARGGNG